MATSSKKLYKAISAVLLISVMITIFALSHQNGSDSSETSGFVTRLLTLAFGDNIPEAIVRTFGHFSEFAALGFLMLNCIFAFSEKKKFILTVILSWLYAWTDEIHQIFIDGRAFQISDLLVDLAGIITGATLIFTAITIYNNIKRRAETK